ncbi:MAG: Na(+)-translocating NADH-quinone reductase subunit A [Bacteroidaceae bacterium]|nr:Na(+)-translocating NADH-quinone reductase subunit A [Bacteroidaceae bacterium]
MERIFKLKKGLDLRLVGEARHEKKVLPLSSEYVVSPTDFYGLTPRLCVKEGDRVLAGAPLFADKDTERVKVVSPVSGTVAAIVRGNRRKITGIMIKADEKNQYADFKQLDLLNATPEKVLEALLETGMFALFRQRPYDVVANPGDKPKGIFVSGFNKMPLAADFSFTVKGEEEAFRTGVKVLAKLAKVYLGIQPEQVNTPILPIEEAEVNIFDGPNPSGNVGVQINHVAPVNRGEVVWTIAPEEVVMIGRLALKGVVDQRKTIAVAGSGIIDPFYYEVLTGAPFADILKDNHKTDGNWRIIKGNPLVGTQSCMEDAVGAHQTELCVIPEGDDVHEVLGWIMPRLNDFSVNHSYHSWLSPKTKAYDLDCRIKGGKRNMIMSGEYDRVFPMDIYAGYLIKAIITGDIDRQEALGIYEVAPEDFAVAEFVDSSKLELQKIVREGLDILRKENA